MDSIFGYALITTNGTGDTNMESKLLMDFDETGNPFIRMKVAGSEGDDVRDKLFKHFTQNLGYESNLLHIEILPGDKESYYYIRPIKKFTLDPTDARHDNIMNAWSLIAFSIGLQPVFHNSIINHEPYGPPMYWKDEKFNQYDLTMFGFVKRDTILKHDIALG